MSLFNKSRRNIRRRNYDDDEDNENKSVEPEDQSSFKTEKSKKKEKPKQTLLSFGEELDEADDGEIFKVKKSSRSRRLMKQLDQERKKKKSDEKMLVGFESSSMARSHEKDLEIKTDDLVVKIKNAGKIVLNGEEAITVSNNDHSSEEEDEERGHKFQSRSAQSANMKFILQSGCIPDAAMIHAARKRRQKARELGHDYIPVEEQRNEGTSSALIREDDQDQSDDEDNEERINMNVNLDALDKENRRQALLDAQMTNKKISDEENAPDDEWEKQQIRKGVTSAQLTANQETVASYNSIGFGQTSCSSQLLIHDNNQAPLSPQLIQCSDSFQNVTLTPEDVLAKIRERLTNIREIHRRHELNYEAVIEELDQSRKELAEGKAQTPEMAQRYKYYQELRGYINDLVECLNEKLPLITALETDWMDLHTERSNFLIERRRQDTRDQAEEVTNAARGYIGRRGPEDDARIRRATEREGRRARRRRTRELASLLHKHIDGMSSDDEITEQQNLVFRQNKAKIETELKEIFLDVEDDFCTAEGILAKFMDWKKCDLESYTEAYVSLCIPKIISPVVRLQLITWNPLVDNTDFEKMKWYNSLIFNRMNYNISEESLQRDPDDRLITSVVEKIIIPKLTTIVQKIWDPLSTSQSLRLIGLVNRLLKEYPSLNKSSKQVDEFFKAILDKMKSSIDNEVFVPIFSKQIMEPRHQFFQRQFAMAIKLLRNFLSWQNVIEDEALKNVALVSLLNRYLLAGLRIMPPAEGLIKANMIMSTLPRVWLQEETIEPLKLLAALVEELNEELDQANPAHNEAREYAKSILKIIKPF